MKERIGIVLLSSGWAGTENSIYNLMKQFPKDICLLVNEEIFPHYKNFNSINLGKVSGKTKLRQYFNYLKIRKKIKGKIKELNLKLLVLFLSESFLVSYKQRIEIIPNLRGTEISEYFSSAKNLRQKILKNIFNKIFKLTPQIISLGKWQIQNLPEKYKKKTVVIPNGVDSKIFKPIKSIKQKNNIILFTGRFIDIKGIREILAVAKQLPKYEFWFAGQGPLANLINLPNTKNLGFQKTEDLVKLYNQSTICIAPSRREAFGNVGLEAMACQKAVIATPLGFSEYIENGKDGIIIPAKNPLALKNAIVDLMENPTKRKKIEKNARKKALGYSWDKIAKQYLKVFEEVVKEDKNKIYNNGGSEIFK